MSCFLRNGPVASTDLGDATTMTSGPLGRYLERLGGSFGRLKSRFGEILKCQKWSLLGSNTWLPVYSSSGCHLISPGLSRAGLGMWCWAWATFMHSDCFKTDVISWKNL